MRATITATILGFLTLALAPASAALAGVKVHIKKGSQTMRVYVNGAHHYTWRISTGRGRYNTPSGSYRPKHLARRHYSSKYNNAPMPYSIFFRGGYAIHGTTEVGRLGRRASHGCVRLHPSNARTLFHLVRANRGRTRIIVSN